MDGGESQKGANNQVLIGVLCGLLVMIVALGVGVMVVMINNSGDGVLEEESDEEIYALDCSNLSDSDDEMVIKCLNKEALSYYDEGDCEKALSVYDDIPEDRFDKYLLNQLYNDAYVLSLSCDTHLREYWENRRYNLASQLEGRN